MPSGRRSVKTGRAAVFLPAEETAGSQLAAVTSPAARSGSPLSGGSVHRDDHCGEPGVGDEGGRLSFLAGQVAFHRRLLIAKQSADRASPQVVGSGTAAEVAERGATIPFAFS